MNFRKQFYSQIGVNNITKQIENVLNQKIISIPLFFKKFRLGKII